MPATNIKNVTFALPVTMMDEIRQVAKKQCHSSINSLVREALERYLEEKRWEEIRQDMLEASRDPLFLADVKGCAASFRHVDHEGVPEW
jgi:metal-responsive CopG/Arc/MetJ family transcriptional regulator